MRNDQQVDVLVIVALREELTALREAFCDELPLAAEPRIVANREYHIFALQHPAGKSELRLGLTCIGGPGRVEAALATFAAVEQFRPHHVILTGIAAATAPFQLNDIAVPRRLIDYSMQKVRHVDDALRCVDYPCSQRWLDLAARAAATGDWQEPFRPKKTYSFVASTVHLNDFSMACGDSVIADASRRDELLERLEDTRRDVRAIDMESTGVAAALKRSSPEPELLVAKGICDRADKEKNDAWHASAAERAAWFVRHLLVRFLDEHQGRYQVNSRRPEPGVNILAVLRPSKSVLAALEHFPDECRHWRDSAIDGAIEVVRTPHGTMPYAGFGRQQIHVDVRDEVWPRCFGPGGVPSGLATRLPRLAGPLQSWLTAVGRTASPNSIRVLRRALRPVVLDHGVLSVWMANSDYFTARTITEVTRREVNDSAIALADIFPKRWTEAESEFPGDCVPYHLSVQGVLIWTERGTANRYLLLASTNPQSATLVHGWGATMAEQIWAPNPPTAHVPWWQEYTTGIEHRPRDMRDGDHSLHDTLVRGLREEFGIDEGKDYEPEPKLLSACIEEGVYFVTFIFAVQVTLTRDELYQKWYHAPDRPEMGILAAYPLEGPGFDGPTQAAKLLASDTFDGGSYALPKPRTDIKPGPWHPSSRMRIYTAATHMYNRAFTQLVRVEAGV